MEEIVRIMRENMEWIFKEHIMKWRMGIGIKMSGRSTSLNRDRSAIHSPLLDPLSYLHPCWQVSWPAGWLAAGTPSWMWVWTMHTMRDITGTLFSGDISRTSGSHPQLEKNIMVYHFHALEVVARGSETQLQVGENLVFNKLYVTIAN